MLTAFSPSDKRFHIGAVCVVCQIGETDAAVSPGGVEYGPAHSARGNGKPLRIYVFRPRALVKYHQPL